MADIITLRITSIPQIYLLALIFIIAFLLHNDEVVVGQESEVHLENYNLYYHNQARNQLSLFPYGDGGRTRITGNLNPFQTGEDIVVIIPMRVEESPLIIDGPITANIYAYGDRIQIETEFIVTIHGEDADMYEDVEFRSQPVQLTSSPQLISFTSPAINWIIEPEGLFTIRVNSSHLGFEAYLTHGDYEWGTHFSLRGNFISLSNVSYGTDEYGTGIFSDPYLLIQEGVSVSIAFSSTDDQFIVYQEEVIIENDDVPGNQLILFPSSNETLKGTFSTFLILADGTKDVKFGPYEELDINSVDETESSITASLSGLIIFVTIVIIIGLLIGYRKKGILYSFYNARIKRHE